MSAELEHVNAHLENGWGLQCQSLQPNVINIDEEAAGNSSGEDIIATKA